VGTGICAIPGLKGETRGTLKSEEESDMDHPPIPPMTVMKLRSWVWHPASLGFIYVIPLHSFSGPRTVSLVCLLLYCPSTHTAKSLRHPNLAASERQYSPYLALCFAGASEARNLGSILG